MITTVCNVHVTDEGIDAFRAASLANAEASRNEPGITRFELMQQVVDRVQAEGIDVWYSLDPAELLGDEATHDGRLGG